MTLEPYPTELRGVIASFDPTKASDVENWLKSIGKADALQPAITAAPCQYVPFELVPELDRLWASRLGVRQRLIGE